MNLILLNFATEVALKQSLGEHIFWSIWYMVLIICTAILLDKTRKTKDGYGFNIIIIIITFFNVVGLIGHLASLKYF